MHKYNVIKILIILLIVIFTTPAFSQTSHITGHITPLESELLENPITLDCGAIIREIRGRTFSPTDINKINQLCTYAHTNFFRFTNHYGLKVKEPKKSFKWNISFLPIDSSYRNLNDFQYRFKNTFIKPDPNNLFAGYTDANTSYAFVLSEPQRNTFFWMVFVHELWHAHSIFYGVLDSYPGTLNQKVTQDEVYANKFTEFLHLGS